MATTTNFGWETPDDTDLVKDGALAIRTLGSAIDTSLVDLKGGTSGQILSKNSNTDMDFVWITNDQGDITGITATSPLTGGGTSGAVTVGIQSASTSQSGAVQLTDSTSSTSTTTAATPNSVKSAYDLANGAIAKSIVDAKGDLIAATAADTVGRLAVGTNGQYLSADSTAATGLAWATPSSGALVKIAGTSFSGVSSVSLDSIFSSTYLNYYTIWNISDTDGNIRLRFRASGSDNTTGNYYTAYHNSTYGSSTVSNTYLNGATYALDLAGSTTSPRFALTFMNPNVSGAQTQAFGQNVRGDSSAGSVFVDFGGGTAFTGFSIYTAGSTMTGDYAVYGIVK